MAYFEATWDLLWVHFGRSRVTLGPLGRYLASLVVYDGSFGGTLWSHLAFDGGFGATLRSVWDYLRHMGVTLGPFWDDFAVALR